MTRMCGWSDEDSDADNYDDGDGDDSYGIVRRIARGIDNGTSDGPSHSFLLLFSPLF